MKGQQGPVKSKYISGEKSATDTHIKTRLEGATVKHDSPVHTGWMVCGQETQFH